MGKILVYQTNAITVAKSSYDGLRATTDRVNILSATIKRANVGNTKTMVMISVAVVGRQVLWSESWRCAGNFSYTKHLVSPISRKQPPCTYIYIEDVVVFKNVAFIRLQILSSLRVGVSLI